jgi:hypothetical protein
MRKTKRLLALLLAFVMLMSTNVTAFASNTTPQSSETNNANDYIYINGKYFSQEEFSALLNATTPEKSLVNQNNQNKPTTLMAAPAVVAVYFVPGLGEVALLATGVIVIGSVAYMAGTWAYDTFNNWLKTSAKQEAKDAADSVSNKVKVNGSNDKIDLGQFTDKNGNTPKNKKSGIFTSRKDNRYTIEKDTAGHTGYDGTIKAWKLFLSGKRVASLNSAGKIVGK